MNNPLLTLKAFGQSLWLDDIRRQMITSGDLQKLIEEDGICGVTSNPAIFEKAIAGSHDYDAAIRVMTLKGKTLDEIYQALTSEDIQHAADLFRPVYDRLGGRDGFVSLEVNPHLAHDTKGTVEEARRLWSRVNRPNVFIKVPATLEGLPAIQRLISEGINVNVTLLFGLPRYRKVAEAYVRGLEERAARGQPINRVASVASFFLSRIDVLVDLLLEKWIKGGATQAQNAPDFRGRVATASAKIAYRIYKETFKDERFRKLADLGAQPQRVLWASTGAKNPAYSDIKYVEALIGPETINTLPQETLHAYRDHGNPALRLEENVEESYEVLRRLDESGIDIERVTQQLEDEGVEKFNTPYDSLMDLLAKKRAGTLEEPLDRQTFHVPRYKTTVQKQLSRLQREQFCSRLWRKDSSLWKSDPENKKSIGNSLGWLHVTDKMEEQLGLLSRFVSEVRAAGFRHVVHMGMGGSSLAPLAFQQILASAGQGIPLTVLDTTDPETILKIERSCPLAETLFIVASKSGTTVESHAFGEFFYSKIKPLKGDRAGENFVAITDPGTPLVTLAHERSYRQTFLNSVDIGGRYSALSYFGLVPAALMGVDVTELLIRVLRMKRSCDASVPIRENPGVALGVVMGELAKRGRDKVTFVMPNSISTFGMWLEQLIAESTGKEGTGLLPIVDEPLCLPPVYGKDRLFVHIRVGKETEDTLEDRIARLGKAGHPVVTIQLFDPLDIGQEIFCWEIATATAGAILGINPFDQPNVQENKDNTNRLLGEIRKSGKLPERSPDLTEGPLRLYGTGTAKSAKKGVEAFLGHAQPGHYVAIQAYLPENPSTTQGLQRIRKHLLEGLHCATTLGYGPRFLHSTGQYHKGGPNAGLFIQLTANDVQDAPIPGAPYTFGVLKAAQAFGDLQALMKHGCRVLCIHLGLDTTKGLEILLGIVESALANPHD